MNATGIQPAPLPAGFKLAEVSVPPLAARHSPLVTSHSVDKYDAPSALGSQARRRFHVMVKPGGSACNLDCSYCFYLSKEHLPNGPAWAACPTRRWRNSSSNTSKA
jgi:hypothetical protein